MLNLWIRRKLMKHMAGNAIRMLVALFGIFLFLMSAGPSPAEAADASATFTVE